MLSSQQNLLENLLYIKKIKEVPNLKTSLILFSNIVHNQIKKYIFLVLLCFLLIAPAALADDHDDDEEDRYRDFDQAIVGDTAALQEAGELQITFSASFEDEDELETVELFVEGEYGVTDWLEVGIQVPYLFLMPKPSDEKDIDGISDATLSVSLFLLAKHPFLVSTSLDVSLPTGNEDKSDDLGEGIVIWEPSLAVDLALGNAELVLDVGGEFGENISKFVSETTLAYAFGEIVPSIGVEASLDGGTKDVSLVPGIGFPIGEDVELAIEVPIGLTNVSSNWKVGVEVTFEF